MGGTTINFNNSGTYIGNPTNPTEACTSVGAADNSGTLNVTLDDGDFVEGTFSIELFCGSTGSTKNLTDGKFRAKIN